MCFYVLSDWYGLIILGKFPKVNLFDEEYFLIYLLHNFYCSALSNLYKGVEFMKKYNIENFLTLIKSNYESDASFERKYNLPQRTVNDWKRGKSTSYMQNILLYARDFGVSVECLLGDGDRELTPKDIAISKIHTMLNELDEETVAMIEKQTSALTEEQQK